MKGVDRILHQRTFWACYYLSQDGVLVHSKPTEESIEEIRLGSTGRTVTRVGLGAMPLSLNGRPNRVQAKAVIRRAVELGIKLRSLHLLQSTVRALEAATASGPLGPPRLKHQDGPNRDARAFPRLHGLPLAKNRARLQEFRALEAML